MAEFPGLGRHCNLDGCRLLDFLPIRCDACEKDFCASHYSYNAHQCQSAFRKDAQVPVCPLCGKPVPVARGERPDRQVSEHIDSDCKSNPAVALKGKIYANHCSLRSCKKRELVPVQCNICGQNFCIKHRLPEDHGCKARRALSETGLAAIRRSNPSQSTVTKESNNSSSLAAGSLSEDEALAWALQESLNNHDDSVDREKHDRRLAEELQRMEYRRQPQHDPSNSVYDRCSMS